MIIYGKQPVLYACERHRERVVQIWLAKEIDAKIFNGLRKLGKPILRVDTMKAQAMARGGNHQGFFVEIESLETLPLNRFKEAKNLLVLNGLTDVGNIGSITRSALALGFDGIIFCGTLPPLEGAVRSSAGALLDMPFSWQKNSLDVVNELKQWGFTLVGTDMKERKSTQNVANKVALFMGNEGEGLPEKLLQKMDSVATITMKNNFDSLNVAHAAAIFMDRIVNARL